MRIRRTECPVSLSPPAMASRLLTLFEFMRDQEALIAKLINKLEHTDTRIVAATEELAALKVAHAKLELEYTIVRTIAETVGRRPGVHEPRVKAAADHAVGKAAATPAATEELAALKVAHAKLQAEHAELHRAYSVLEKL